MKRISCLIGFILVISMLLLSSCTAYDVGLIVDDVLERQRSAEEDFRYEIVDGEAIITECLAKGGKFSSFDIVIPAELGGCKVVEIGANAFSNNSSIVSLVIPDTVERIGNEAFYGMWYLDEIRIPASVKEIGDRAFGDITPFYIEVDPENEYYSSADGNLYNKDGTVLIQHTRKRDEESVTVPNGVLELAPYSFYDCYNLKEVTLPDSLITIGENAFGCSNVVEKLVIPDSVAQIGRFALVGCKCVSVAEGNQNYKSIDGTVYSLDGSILIKQSDSVTDFVVPEGVTRIAEAAFKYVDIESISLPETLESIGESAFRACKLKAVDIPEGVKIIEKEAFYSCRELTDVYISSTVEEIGENVFVYNHKLVNIDVKQGNERYKSIEGSLYTKDGRVLLQYAIGKTDEEFRITDGIEKISKSAFRECSYIERVVMPDSIVKIEEYAFYGCRKLKNVTLSNRLEHIGKSAFMSTDIDDIVLPASVNYIGGYAFCYKNELSNYVFVTFENVYGWTATNDEGVKTSIEPGFLSSKMMSLSTYRKYSDCDWIRE